MTSTRPLCAFLSAATFLLLTSCGKSGGVSLGGSSTGAFDSAVGQATAQFVVLDLTTGAKTSSNTLDDTATDLRSTKMAFRRVTGLGSDYLLGIFEVTQAQWQLILGISDSNSTTLPWNTISPKFAGTLDGRKPAIGLSFNLIQSGLGGFTKAKLSLPTDAQWSFACAAGTDPEFWSWGNITQIATVEANAHTFETAVNSSNRTVPLNSPFGPDVVGGAGLKIRQANLFGFYDMHGNAWEWTADKNVRGGSWRDSFQLARTRNSLGLTEGVTAATAHALFGARLILTP